MNKPGMNSTFVFVTVKNPTGQPIHAVVLATRDSTFSPPGTKTPFKILARLPGAIDVTLAPQEKASLGPDGIKQFPYDLNMRVWVFCLRYEFL